MAKAQSTANLDFPNYTEEQDFQEKYAYVLSQKNEKRGGVYDEFNNRRSEAEFKPYLNILFSSSINWPGGIDPFSKKERPRGRYSICFYEGCTTLFVDDQPRELDTLKALKSATRERTFSYGYCYIDGYDRLLKMYMDWASYNEESPYRVPSVEVKWKGVNTEKDIISQKDLMDLEDEARKLSKEAPVKKMRIHAKYLGVPLEDTITNVPFKDEAVRVEYRKIANANPKWFVESYNDKTVEVRTWVNEAINTGAISTTVLPNKVAWAKGGGAILDTSGIKSTDIIADMLVEHTQTDDGSDFLSQLKSLYS